LSNKDKEKGSGNEGLQVGKEKEEGREN